MSRLVMFDMDRTLLSKETASLYVRYQRRIGEASTMDLARTLFWVFEYTVGTLDAERVAEKAISTLRGSRESDLYDKCDRWFLEEVRGLLTAGGYRAVTRHLAEGDTCAIVTGASRYVAAPLARMLGIDHLVTTEFEVDAEGRFTGAPALPLCLGQGKKTRAEALAKRLGYALAEATFYSDSHTDLPLLNAVATPVCVNPDRRLRSEALRRRWSIERWY